MADLLVAFDGHVPLAQALEVATAAGSVFTRRPMTRRELDELVEDPAGPRLEDL